MEWTRRLLRFAVPSNPVELQMALTNIATQRPDKRQSSRTEISLCVFPDLRHLFHDLLLLNHEFEAELHILYLGGSEASAMNVTVTSWPSDNFTLIVSSLNDFLSLVSNSFPDPVISPLRTPPVIFRIISSGEEALSFHVP